MRVTLFLNIALLLLHNRLVKLHKNTDGYAFVDYLNTNVNINS